MDNINVNNKNNNNMIYKDNYGNDLTWAIGLQMENKLTRVDVLGIIETHKLNTNTNG